MAALLSRIDNFARSIVLPAAAPTTIRHAAVIQYISLAPPPQLVFVLNSDTITNDLATIAELADKARKVAHTGARVIFESSLKLALLKALYPSHKNIAFITSFDGGFYQTGTNACVPLDAFADFMAAILVLNWPWPISVTSNTITIDIANTDQRHGDVLNKLYSLRAHHPITICHHSESIVVKNRAKPSRRAARKQIFAQWRIQDPHMVMLANAPEADYFFDFYLGLSKFHWPRFTTVIIYILAGLGLVFCCISFLIFPSFYHSVPELFQ